MARGIELLHKNVQGYARELQEKCEKQGLRIKITDTLRTKAEQNALYAQGRTAPGQIVTNAKYPQSNHCWGIAFDFCRDDGRGAFDDSDGFFSKVGQVGKSIGLSWGGDWTSFKDKPHFEYTGFGKWRDLQNKYGTPEKFLGTSNPASSAASGNVLKLGSEGDKVKELQNKLNSLGYDCGAADGIFGSKTLAAVKAFQKDKGLAVDGVVGVNTNAALAAAAKSGTDAVATKNTNENVKVFQSELNKQFNKGLVVDGIWGSKTEAAAVNVKKGAEGELTRLIQKCLNNKGYDCGNVDGIFGIKTETGVMKFQKENGLVIDGIVGKNTWKLLLS